MLRARVPIELTRIVANSSEISRGPYLVKEQGHKNILTKTDRFYLDAIRRKRIAAFTSMPSRRGMKLGLLDGDSKMVAAT